jgi:hypothetical protein
MLLFKGCGKTYSRQAGKNSKKSNSKKAGFILDK